MNTERDDFDVFLETWEPSELLNYATLDSNLFDPFAEDRLLADMKGTGLVQRTAYVEGPKRIARRERQLRNFDYFKLKQKEWSEDFRSRLISRGLDEAAVRLFVRSFAKDWIDGSSRRQKSSVMMAIKASIRDHDRHYHNKYADQYVLKSLPDSVAPLFCPEEMRVIFQTNCDLLETCFADYIAELYGGRSGSINDQYLRRGVCMPEIPGELREELHYLSSYSLAVTPVEQFARIYTKDTKESGVPCIFSAPLPALQDRVVAFSPFVKGMDISQLEFVIAPPIQPTPLSNVGEWSGIKEYEFN